MDKCLLSFIILLLLATIFSSCEKNNNTINPTLSFSEDTIHFDTVFTTIGSTTRELRVLNTGGKITIDEIYLSGGQGSMFRLNIDGEPVSRKEGLTLESGDSIFIFIDVIIDPTNSNIPVAVMDSIIFSVAGFVQQVQLLAWGQDIFLLSNEIIESETWNDHKPYVIYGNVIVDTLETLTIEAGTRIYFHKKASLKVAGNIDVRGSFDSPVLFASDRLEKQYEDVPGQWEGIIIFGTSVVNNISHAIIRNSIFGLRIGEGVTAGAGPGLKLFYTDISHSAITGLSAVNSAVEAANCIFSHCGKFCIYVSSGGEYSFTHCTVSNQWDYGYRLTPAVNITEKSVLPGGTTRQLNFDLNNCVVYGDLDSELDIMPLAKSYTGNYYFDHCLLKLDTINSGFWVRERFPETLIDKNPCFIDQSAYDFRPDTLSPLINNGADIYSAGYPLDFRNVSRVADGKPDIGAYERLPGEQKKNNR